MSVEGHSSLLSDSIFTACVAKRAKVMFPQACVTHSVQLGGDTKCIMGCIPLWSEVNHFPSRVRGQPFPSQHTETTVNRLAYWNAFLSGSIPFIFINAVYNCRLWVFSHMIYNKNKRIFTQSQNIITTVLRMRPDTFFTLSHNNRNPFAVNWY